MDEAARCRGPEELSRGPAGRLDEPEPEPELEPDEPPEPAGA